MEGSALKIIWYALVDHDGKPYSKSTTNSVKIDKIENVDVHDFRKVAYHECAVILSGISPSQLLIYSNKEAFDNREKESPLEVDAVINDYGKAQNDALIVMVPSLLDDTSNQRKRHRIFSRANIEDELRSEDITKERLSIEDDILNVQSNRRNPINPEDLGQIMTVPHDAPQTFRFSGDKFYIRSCYHEYYDIIMDKLIDEYSYISVTGTPGIGKSIFYLYFLTRYQLENPGKSVIVASFGEQQNLNECKVFRPNGVVEKCTVHGKYVIPVFNTISWPKGIDCDLYLYDGPPLGIPDKVKMIAFTSPHFLWLDSMRKHGSHCKLFMPSLDLNELFATNEVLQLNIDKNVLIQRYDLFGGSARYCLSTCDIFISLRESEIDSVIFGINKMHDLKKFFLGNFDQEDMVDRIMQYIPEDEVHFAKLYPASLSISRKLYEQIKKILNVEQKLFVEYFNGIEKGSPYAAWLIQASMQNRLLVNGAFEM